MVALLARVIQKQCYLLDLEAICIGEKAPWSPGKVYCPCDSVEIEGAACLLTGGQEVLMLDKLHPVIPSLLY